MRWTQQPSIVYIDVSKAHEMSPSWLIDCRNTSNPLIDYTARPDEEWRHVPNNTDKIDETHLQENEYFYPGVRTKKWYTFFQTHFYWLLSMREKSAIHHDRTGKIRIYFMIYTVYLPSAKCVLYWIISLSLYKNSSSDIQSLAPNIHLSINN